jgi:hypothetical protein
MQVKFVLVLVFVFCFSFFSFSQKEEFNLVWKSSTVSISSNDNNFLLHGFQAKNFSYNFSDKSLLFATLLNKPYSNATIVSVSFQLLSASQIRGYDKKLIKNEVEFNLRKSQGRNNIGAYLEFNPIVNQNGVYKKVTSIVFNFSSDNSFVSRSTLSKAIVNSNLSTGSWYKFYIEKTGVHKLDKGFMKSIGVDVDNVNPKNIRLFGNGGKSIPLINNDVTQFDVTENAVKFVGEEDNVFNNSDYLVFYGVSSLGWDDQNDSFINPYTDKTYYYINVSDSPGKRITSLQEPSANPSVFFNTFNELKYYELDKVNLVQLGRRWFGDPFDVASNQNFTFNFPNIDVTLPVLIKVKAAAVSSTSSRMQVLLNGNQIDNLNFSSIDSNVLAKGDFYFGSQNVSSSAINLDLNYINNGNPSANAYLDYISIEATSFLRSLGVQFAFTNKEASVLSGVGQYTIANSSNILEVWDVTDFFNVKSKVNLGGETFSFKSVLGENRDYVALVDSDFYLPLKDDLTSVDNVNLKGTIFSNNDGVLEDIDYLVITPTIFKSQADRLARINALNNGLRTRVVTLDQVYSEFNTGNQDIGAIRNFVKYIYDNAQKDKLKYLCLFGDGSFDMKNRTSGNTNLVPSFHTLQSFSTITGFISDDYFGLMDDFEGALSFSDRLDIAVGRIVANNLQQATEMVTKVERYYNQDSYGAWRNSVTIISDDVDVTSDFQLEDKLDVLSDEIVAKRPFINMQKIHLDSYLQEVTAGGESYPKAKEDLLNAIQLGSSVVNYFGHGGEDGLAAERLFLKKDAIDLNNSYRYNVFVTITCDFTRFDNPLRETGGELMYWNKDGGAVSLVATTRKIFFSTAISINKELAKYLFDFSDGGYVSVAEALRLAKNNISSSNKRVVFNVGDPALKLPFPKPSIRLTHINDVSILDDNVPSIQALSKVSLAGEVIDEGGQLISGYNGELSTILFDKMQERTTLGNDGVSGTNGLLLIDYETLGERVFKGKASIRNGKFKFDFVVPRDISIPLGAGRISFYSKRNNVLEDQTGVNTSVVIGGINEDAPEDNLPPTIAAFMNDESFVSGGVTNQSPFLLINLEDENGINTSSGIGHDITAVLDGDETKPFVLNDYYETDLDDYTKGKVRFQYRDLEPGLHTLLIKAWDVYNNSISTEIQFIVINENEQLVVSRVLNYPNPFVSYTEFWFNHNSSSELDVMVQVYTVTGRLIKTLRGNSFSDNNNVSTSLFRGLPWDGKDDFGSKIGKGVYVYKLTVRSVSTNKKVVKFEKLVIL